MRVIIADDAVVVREGLARLLVEYGVSVLATVNDAVELLARVDADPPDVAVIDIRMPPTYTHEGLVVAEQIRRTHPEVATMVLSQYVEVDYALRLTTGGSGRVGYLLKDRIVDVEEFVDALRRVAAGGLVVEPALVSDLVAAPGGADPLAALTPREREVLAMVALGKTDRGIAEELVVTRKTVESHVRSILGKLDLPDDTTENRRVHAVLAYLHRKGAGVGRLDGRPDRARPGISN